MPDQKIKEIRFRLDELERKIRGGTLANARVAKLERELKSLKALMENGFDPGFISDKISALDKGLADHEVRISGLEGSVEVLIDESARAHARVTDVEKVVAEDRKVTRTTENRVNVLEEEVNRTAPISGVVLAILVGVCAGLLWAHHDWSSTLAVNDQLSTIRSAADMAICAWLFGAGVGFAMLALTLLATGPRTRTETINSASAHQVASTPQADTRSAQAALVS